MKMSEKTLLKKIEQAFKENYCNGSYKLEIKHEYEDVTYYVLFYTYEMGETIALDIIVSLLGEVRFYSPVHGYYISNFNNHTKSVINVLRMLFDMIDSNKEKMVSYYGVKTETVKEVMEVKQELNARFGKEQYAINNPEWHHVSLATLANIDNDMMDDKRQLYITVWSELNKTLKNLHKCNSGLSYERALSPLRRWVLELYHNKKITGNFKRYVDIKISMCNVECGVWASAVEVATGQHESRKYNRPALRY